MMLQTDRRDHLDLQVNILTEQELTMALRMLRQLCDHAELPPESENQGKVEELMQETNVHDVMSRLNQELPTE
jgi:hypothetical protein